MKDMMYDYVILAVVVLLIATYVIGDDNSIQSNLDHIAKSNTSKINELIV